MRLFYILIFFSFFGFSQTNEGLINQAAQTAKSQNITTQAQAIQALAASGMTESQARQLAAQRGISYDELLNDYFSDEINIESSTDPDTSILEEASISDVNEVIEDSNTFRWVSHYKKYDAHIKPGRYVITDGMNTTN